MSPRIRIRRSRESGDPASFVFPTKTRQRHWVPACAGTTGFPRRRALTDVTPEQDFVVRARRPEHEFVVPAKAGTQRRSSLRRKPRNDAGFPRARERRLRGASGIDGCRPEFEFVVPAKAGTRRRSSLRRKPGNDTGFPRARERRASSDSGRGRTSPEQDFVVRARRPEQDFVVRARHPEHEFVVPAKAGTQRRSSLRRKPRNDTGFPRARERRASSDSGRDERHRRTRFRRSCTPLRTRIRRSRESGNPASFGACRNDARPVGCHPGEGRGPISRHPRLDRHNPNPFCTGRSE